MSADIGDRLRSLFEVQSQAVVVGDAPPMRTETTGRSGLRHGWLIAAACAVVLVGGVAVWALGNGPADDELTTPVPSASSTTTTVWDEESGAPPEACGIRMFDGRYSGVVLITDGSLSYVGERTEPTDLLEVGVDGDVDVIVPAIVDLVEGVEVVDDWSRLWFRPGARLIDAEAMRTDQVQGDVLVWGHVGQFGGESANFITQAIAPVAADGTVRMMGECGDEVQRDLEAGAALLGRPVDVEFMVDLRRGDHDIAAAIEQATTPSVPDEREQIRQAWLDTPVERRSLRVEDVPIEERDDYELLVLAVEPTDLAVGPMIGAMTDAGVLQVFVPGEGIFPVLVPADVTEVRIAFSVSSPGLFEPESVVATFPLSVFDPATGGASLRFAESRDGPQVAMRPLAEGELEKLTGMTRAQLEARRDQLLAQ